MPEVFENKLQPVKNISFETEDYTKLMFKIYMKIQSA